MKNVLKTVNVKLTTISTATGKQSKQKESKTQNYLVQPTLKQIQKKQYWKNIHQINKLTLSTKS